MRRLLVFARRPRVGWMFAGFHRTHRIAQGLIGARALASSQFVRDQLLRLAPSLLVATCVLIMCFTHFVAPLFAMTVLASLWLAADAPVRHHHRRSAAAVAWRNTPARRESPSYAGGKIPQSSPGRALAIDWHPRIARERMGGSIDRGTA